MSTRLDRLIQQWQEGWRAGGPVSPDELCRDSPELLQPLRRVIRAQQSVGLPPETVWPQSVEQAETKPLGGPAESKTSAPLADVEFRAGTEPVPGFRLVRLLGRGGFG